MNAPSKRGEPNAGSPLATELTDDDFVFEVDGFLGSKPDATHQPPGEFAVPPVPGHLQEPSPGMPPAEPSLEEDREADPVAPAATSPVLLRSRPRTLRTEQPPPPLFEEGKQFVRYPIDAVMTGSRLIDGRCAVWKVRIDFKKWDTPSRQHEKHGQLRLVPMVRSSENPDRWKKVGGRPIFYDPDPVTGPPASWQPAFEQWDRAKVRLAAPAEIILPLRTRLKVGTHPPDAPPVLILQYQTLEYVVVNPGDRLAVIDSEVPVVKGQWNLDQFDDPERMVTDVQQHSGLLSTLVPRDLGIGL